jgi:MarR family transcriptional regulator, transcriptional regulator for hemolysin
MLHRTIQILKEPPMPAAASENRSDSSPRQLRHWHRRVPAVGQLFDAFSGLRKTPVAAAPVKLRTAIAATEPSGTADTLLGFLIHDVSRTRRSAFDQFMKPLGITQAQWWVLQHLSQTDGMMQTQLADVLGVGKASLGNIIESIEAGGWAQRRSDPSDRRIKRIFLTASAQSMIQRVAAMEAQFNNRVLGELPPVDRTELSRMLLAVKQAIAGLNPGAGAAAAGA